MPLQTACPGLPQKIHTTRAGVCTHTTGRHLLRRSANRHGSSRSVRVSTTIGSPFRADSCPGSTVAVAVAVVAAAVAAVFVVAHEAVGHEDVSDGDARAGERPGDVRGHPRRGEVDGFHAEALEADVDPHAEADAARGRARAVEVLADPPPTHKFGNLGISGQ